MLVEYEELFNGTLGDFKTDPVSLKSNKGATPYHGWPFPNPHVHLDVLKKEVERLCELGVLNSFPSMAALVQPISNLYFEGENHCLLTFARLFYKCKDEYFIY